MRVPQRDFKIMSLRAATAHSLCDSEKVKFGKKVEEREARTEASNLHKNYLHH